jgi:hypothetical protein
MASFKGHYQYVEVEITSDVLVTTRTLTEKTAANPDTQIGVIVDMANGMDRMLIVGDDAYRMDKVSVNDVHRRMAHAPGAETNREDLDHPWAEDEGFGTYGVEKKPAGTADMLLELLNLKEK